MPVFPPAAISCPIAPVSPATLVSPQFALIIASLGGRGLLVVSRPHLVASSPRVAASSPLRAHSATNQEMGAGGDLNMKMSSILTKRGSVWESAMQVQRRTVQRWRRQQGMDDDDDVSGDENQELGTQLVHRQQQQLRRQQQQLRRQQQLQPQPQPQQHLKKPTGVSNAKSSIFSPEPSQSPMISPRLLSPSLMSSSSASAASSSLMIVDGMRCIAEG